MTGLWDWIESNRARLFLAAGAMLALDAVIVVAEIVTGTEGLLVFGETFSALGWALALIGLLGLYRSHVDRTPWLARVGAVFAAVGVLTFVLLAAASFVYGTGLAAGDIGAIVPVFLPGVLLGSVVAFVLFSTAILRMEQASRTFGALLLVPPAIVVVNILTGVAGLGSSWLVLLVVVGLSVTFTSVGRVMPMEGRSIRGAQRSV